MSKEESIISEILVPDKDIVVVKSAQNRCWYCQTIYSQDHLCDICFQCSQCCRDSMCNAYDEYV